MNIKNYDLNKGFIQNNELIKELSNSTDRAKVILGAAIIDELLERLIRAFLVQNRALIKQSFETATGPLGTFSAKIKMSYLLGLISIELFNDIENIRQIRNNGAHNILKIELDSIPLKYYCDRLKFARTAYKTDWAKQGNSTLFVLEIAILQIILVKKITRIKALEPLQLETNFGFEQIDWDYLNS